MKILSILLIIAISISYINATCLNCLGEGEICDLNNQKCGNGLGCFYKNGDNSQTTCQKYIKESEDCSKINGINNCDIGFDCVRDGSDRVCLPTKYIQKDGFCKNDYECTGSLVCKNGFCNKDSILDSCKFDNDCKYDEFCNEDGFCNKIKTINQLCKSGECFYGQECRANGDSVFNTCQTIKKLAFGETCKFNSNYQQCNFNQNLYCAKTNICERFIVESITNCSTTSCGDYQSCSCDGKCYQSSPYPTDQPTLEYNLRKCAYDNRCALVDNLVTRQSCIADNCRSEICDYQHSKINTGAPDSCGNQYILDRYCNSSSTLSLISTLSILLLSIICYLFI